MQPDDVEWMVDLSARRYPPDFDVEAGGVWVRDFVLKQPWQFFPARTDNAFVVTMISIIPWLPKHWEANVIMVCAEEGCAWEAMRLLRVSLFWARKRQCAEWRLRTATEFDIGPMARRVGAVELPPCYAVRL
jgi:hypothetical protein